MGKSEQRPTQLKPLAQAAFVDEQPLSFSRMPLPAGIFDVGVDAGADAARLNGLLEERLRVEQLLADLCVRFTALSEDQADGEMEMWMRRLADMLHADRSSF